MDYEKILLKIKIKADMLMERDDPTDPMHEACYTIDGKYIDRREIIYNHENWTHSFLNGIIAYLYFHFKEEKYHDYLLKQKEIYTTLLFDK